MTGVRLARDISREVPKQHAFEVEALRPVPGQRGLITKAEVLKEIKGLKEKAGKAR